MLKGKNVIITGANRGIGNAILRLFARNHANAWCLVRQVEPSFEAQIKDLERKHGVWLRPVTVDLADRDSIREAMTAIVADKKDIDILVNNAGRNHRGTFLMTSIEEMEALYQVNYYAPLQLMQLVAKRMVRKRRGVIVNIGSVSGLEHNTGNFAYAATKTSLMWATRTLSRELAPYNIRVNGVAPGLTDTRINEGNEAVLNETVIPRMNIKRSGTPEEIAQAVLFMASDASSFVSGQILCVDGGRF